MGDEEEARETNSAIFPFRPAASGCLLRPRLRRPLLSRSHHHARLKLPWKLCLVFSRPLFLSRRAPPRRSPRRGRR